MGSRKKKPPKAPAARKAPPLRFPAEAAPAAPKSESRDIPTSPPQPPTEPPAEQAEQARLPNGQFPRGVSGNPSGRPKGVRDLRTILVEHFETQGLDIEQAAIAIVGGLLREAKAGDVPAAKLLLDRLFPQKMELGESFVDLVRGAWAKPPETPPT